MKKKCPRCGGKTPNDATPGAYPGALSRWDGETEVCSACGSHEAIIEYQHRTYRERAECVHPIRGEFKWVYPPATAREPIEPA